jgi:hypothetical protein
MPEPTPLWTLYLDGRTASADIHDQGSYGLELRYTRDGAPLAWIRFQDGAELLREAQIGRFELEARGWRERRGTWTNNSPNSSL